MHKRSCTCTGHLAAAQVPSLATASTREMYSLQTSPVLALLISPGTLVMERFLLHAIQYIPTEAPVYLQ
jgi:hypothetical protein